MLSLIYGGVNDNMKIGFIGCGNMANAIINGLINNDSISAENINIFDINYPSAEKLHNIYPLNIMDNERQTVEKSDVVILAVKPNVLASVLVKISDLLKNKDKLIISIAAGKTTEFISSTIKNDCKIIRVMPNINAKVGEAISAYTTNNEVTEKDKQICENIFSAVGKVIYLDESYFPLFGVLGGCTPAFAYMFIDALARVGVENGMTKDTALKISAQAVMGSAKMILESNEHPWELIDKVCSPGGTTIEGVISLQADGFENAVHNAVNKAIEKDSKL